MNIQDFQVASFFLIFITVPSPRYLRCLVHVEVYWYKLWSLQSLSTIFAVAWWAEHGTLISQQLSEIGNLQMPSPVTSCDHILL